MIPVRLVIEGAVSPIHPEINPKGHINAPRRPEEVRVRPDFPFGIFRDPADVVLNPVRAFLAEERDLVVERKRPVRGSEDRRPLKLGLGSEERERENVKVDEVRELFEGSQHGDRVRVLRIDRDERGSPPRVSRVRHAGRAVGRDPIRSDKRLEHLLRVPVGRDPHHPVGFADHIRTPPGPRVRGGPFRLIADPGPGRQRFRCARRRGTRGPSRQ